MTEVLTHSLAHLAPADLASVALVSKRFHNLVTGPHAWRSAFAHFFPGAESINFIFGDDESDSSGNVRSGRRAFTRLTALASWRSEYVLRTRLLHSLARGKPVQAIASPSSARSGHAHTALPTVMYNSQLFTTINHLHASFGTGLNKRLPRCVHGADDQGLATSSDPAAGKVDPWGQSDPQIFLQFNERFPGDTQYGLGPGEVVGVPNVMDVSQTHGMVHGDGFPSGMVYYRSTDEMRGRFLAMSSAMSDVEIGIPRILGNHEAFSCVWIAKSSAIPHLTDGLVGLLAGSSLGVLNAYSLGSTNNSAHRKQRFPRGELTARWVLSPGVPLIAIAVDDDYGIGRYAQNRIWAVVLNALGEVFYLTKFPKRPSTGSPGRMDEEAIERTAWLSGRSVYWNIVESSRRKARPDPYADSAVDGSYSPRSSWNGMCLDKSQIAAETREIESFATRLPKDFQKACLGWDMRRRLEVDFAGDDGNNAGENVVVLECGLDEDSTTSVTRFTRCRFREWHSMDPITTPPLTSASTRASVSPPTVESIDVPGTATGVEGSFDTLEDSLSQDDMAGTSTPRPMSEEWRVSQFTLGGLRKMQILATTMDSSTFAAQTTSEDPLLTISARSTSSSPSMTPLSQENRTANADDVPGQRARLLAAGTNTGSVVLWDIRASVPGASQPVNTIEPVRIVYTSSPQISCLALSALYLVHGGNDGLVQAWDPLGSDLQPIRTLHSRFRQRARRQLVQAQASPQGVGINLFAAGAICLDPDPTVLRGIVSLGTQLLYWSFSSSAADQYKSQKRRLRRSERGSNNSGERFSNSARGNLKDYIYAERLELDREKKEKKKETQRFANRFGTDLLDGSEEEMMAYAAMLSQETLELENFRRVSDASTTVSTSNHSTMATTSATPLDSATPPMSASQGDEALDADLAEAIRQSLASSPAPAGSSHSIPVRHAKAKPGRRGSPGRASAGASPTAATSSSANELTDLEFALQLSLAEEQSRLDSASTIADDSSVIQSAEGRGSKGKERAP